MRYAIAAVFLISGPLFAAPTITSVSGVYSAGQAITITCTGAGSKPRAEPIIYDDFDKGTIQPDSVYSSSKTWTEIQSMTLVSTNCYAGAGCAGEVAGWETGRETHLQISHEILGNGASYYWSWVWKSDAVDYSTDNWKTWRWWHASNTMPDMFIGTQVDDGLINQMESTDGFAQAGLDLFYLQCPPLNCTGNTPEKILPKAAQYDGWEVFIKYSSGTMATDGTVSVKHNGNVMMSTSSFRMRYTVSSGFMNQFYFEVVQTGGAGSSPPPKAPKYVRYDNLYMDSSWARVYVTTSTAGGISNPAPATSWSNTSVSAVIPSMPVSAGQTIYLYLCDANNNCSPGFSLLSGGTLSTAGKTSLNGHMVGKGKLKL